jgi:hypothetical protein
MVSPAESATQFLQCCKQQVDGQKALNMKRTHMPRAFDRLRDHSMVLPTQAVLPTITNRTELPDVLVQ